MQILIAFVAVICDFDQFLDVYFSFYLFNYTVPNQLLFTQKINDANISSQKIGGDVFMTL
jgi:hypothetical protein